MVIFYILWTVIENLQYREEFNKFNILYSQTLRKAQLQQCALILMITFVAQGTDRFATYQATSSVVIVLECVIIFEQSYVSHLRVN